MSILSRLFGGSSAPKTKAEAETYKDFRILSEPTKETGGYRVSARIEREIDGEVRSHHLIRADICDSLDTARTMSVKKAKQVIDEQGNALFR